jgi:hypothetical protein
MCHTSTHSHIHHRKGTLKMGRKVMKPELSKVLKPNTLKSNSFSQFFSFSIPPSEAMGTPYYRLLIDLRLHTFFCCFPFFFPSSSSCSPSCSSIFFNLHPPSDSSFRNDSGCCCQGCTCNSKSSTKGKFKVLQEATKGHSKCPNCHSRAMRSKL